MAASFPWPRGAPHMRAAECLKSLPRTVSFAVLMPNPAASPGSTGGTASPTGNDNAVTVRTGQRPSDGAYDSGGNGYAGPHTHPAMPPYYALAFIMKVG